jgi:hypothetical protein
LGGYNDKLRQVSRDNDLTDPNDVIFIEVTVTDPSEFASHLDVTGEVQHGRYRVLTLNSSTIPNALAALLLTVRDHTDRLPHIYFEWTEGNPAANLIRFLSLVSEKSRRSPARSSAVPNTIGTAGPTFTSGDRESAMGRPTTHDHKRKT